MSMATVNPATGEQVGTVPAHDGAEVERRIVAATQAAATLRSTSFEQRATWMRATADVLEADQDEVARVITLEMGKPIAQARAEVAKCVTCMRFYAEHAATFLADQPLAEPSQVDASQAYVTHQPLGVVLAVMPWNYPLWQVIRFAAPALMAGNAGLLKHASNVPQAAVYLDALFGRGGFPAGSFGTLLIGSDAVEAVIEDDRIAAVTLTGSEPAGRAVAATAGGAIKKTVLELGGSDPFIVMPSADLTAAVQTAVQARTTNNGQSCIAAKRFLVHTDVYDAFVSDFTAQMAALRLGDPSEEEVDLGPLATSAGRDDLHALVQDAVDGGATLLLGGTIPDRAGWFYPATVLTDLPAKAAILQEEAFGPVASVYRVRDVEEALRIANQTSFGLSSAVWTTDADEERRFVADLQAGAVFVNGMTVSYPHLPFGGIKDSGYGRELADAGIREFTNVKTVWKG